MKRIIHLKRIAGIIAILVLLLGLLPIGAVFAQDETPPAEDPAPAPQPEVEITPEVVLEPMPTPEEKAAVKKEESKAAVDVTAAVGPTPEEEVLPETVAALAQAGAVLVSDCGKEIPLASEEAAEVLSAADPYFTSAGVKYCFISAGSCAASCDVCSVTTTPMQDAVDAAKLDPPDDETIYVEGGNYDGFKVENFTTNLIIIGGVGPGDTWFYGQIYLTGNIGNVTLSDFGVSHGNSGEEANSGNTPAILAINNSGVLTLLDLDLVSSDDSALWVDDHHGDVVLDNVDATANGNDQAAYINNTAGTGDVKVMGSGSSHSDFYSEEDTGLEVHSAGHIMLHHVRANNSGDDSYTGDGAYLDNRYGDKNVSIYFSEFNNNYDDGLQVFSDGWILLHGVTANDNYDVGAFLETSGEKIIVRHSVFDDTGSGKSQNYGLVIKNLNQESHETTVCDVEALLNDYVQIWLESPEGSQSSDFVYNLCDIWTDDDDRDDWEIKILGGKDGCGWTNMTVNYNDIHTNTNGNWWDEVYWENDINWNWVCDCGCPGTCNAYECGDGFLSPGEECDPGNGDDIPATHPGCTQECTFDYGEFGLDLDPYCVDVEGEWRMQWEINNPNAFQVDVNWATSDGQMGMATLDPGINEITTTELGTWTMTANWAGGGDALEYTINDCEPGGGGGNGGGPLLAVADLIIPVTGEDQLLASVLPLGSALIVGLGLLVKGVYGKIKK